MSGGRVAGGKAGDADTAASGLKTRHIEERYKTTEAIDKAIDNHVDDEYYNELVLEDPEIAGIFFKCDYDEFPSMHEDEEILFDTGNDTYDEWWEKLKKATEIGAPFFIVESKNRVRMVYGIDFAKKSFKVTPQYLPETIIDMPGIYQKHLGEDEKRRAIMQVIDKAAGLIPEEEREKYVSGETKKDSGPFIDIPNA